jgi:sec-independent protein translocase protein TatA
MIGLIPHIGAVELILILGLALIIFGPGRLPDVGKSLGKTIKEFRSANKDEASSVPQLKKEGEKQAD